MIYLTYKYCSNWESTIINNVWESSFPDLEDSYKSFLLKKAKERDIVINPHWGNIMNYEDNNTHLKKSVYNKAVKEWTEYLKEMSFDNYVEVHGLATKKEVTSISL